MHDYFSQSLAWGNAPRVWSLQQSLKCVINMITEWYLTTPEKLVLKSLLSCLVHWDLSSGTSSAQGLARVCCSGRRSPTS